MERHDDTRRIQCHSIPHVLLCMDQPDLFAAVCIPRIYSTLNMHCSISRVQAVWNVTCEVADAPPLWPLADPGGHILGSRAPKDQSDPFPPPPKWSIGVIFFTALDYFFTDMRVVTKHWRFLMATIFLAFS